MIADLIADGDHDGCTALIKAAIPVICGQAMEVPERMLELIFATAGDQAARIFSPGAVISGFRISGVKPLGPFEENEAIRGAG